MANPEKGEVDFEVDGKRYILSYSVNAICALEEKTGKSVLQIQQDIGRWARNRAEMKISTVRTLFWAGLLDHQKTTTIEEAGVLMQDAGGLVVIFTLVMQAMTRSQPPADGMKDTRPRKRR